MAHSSQIYQVTKERGNDPLVRLAPVFGVVLLGLAFLSAFDVLARSWKDWIVVGAGVCMLLVSYRAARLLAELRESERASKTRADLLDRQISRQRQAVDALADGLDVAIFICDAKGVIEYANKSAVTNFRFERPIGRSVLAVTLSYDLERLVAEAAKVKAVQTAELSFSYPEERVALARAWFDSEDGERVFLTIYDITDLRKLERVRQDFVANVSHELRTPMTSIRAMSETLLESDSDAKLRERYLQKIIDEVDRLTLISNDLLILSASESNPVRKNTCDLVTIVRGVVGQLEEKALAKGLTLRLTAPSELPLEANAAQMIQVAINLIDNAIIYTSEGEVHVELTELEGNVQMRVSDTGIGISTEHLPRIFERFYRVDKGRSRASGGTGLGLSIVKHIVESHGGKVFVTSALNRGSTFTVTLPKGSSK